MEVPKPKETRIHILKPEEITRLLHTAERYRDGKCLAAVGMMLYAGIRPHEVARLTWDEVDLEDGEGYISYSGAKFVNVKEKQNCNLCIKAFTNNK